MNYIPRFNIEMAPPRRTEIADRAAAPAVTPSRVAAAFAGWSASPVRRGWTIPSVHAWHDKAGG